MTPLESVRPVIYLVRHGHAEAGPVDRLRALSDRGREDVRRVAREAAGRGVRVAAIWHSGLLRAAQTAEILASELSPGLAAHEAPGLAPDDEPGIARRALDAVAEPTVVVGHLPHLARLAALLLTGDPGGDVVRFEAGTMVAVSREAGRWTLGWTLSPALSPSQRPGT
jgi:phosphohistidine phosphatase